MARALVKNIGQMVTAAAYVSADEIGKTANTEYKISFNTERWDIGGYFDSTTNYRYLPLVKGKYLITFNLNLFSESSNNAAGSYAVLKKNGTSYQTFNYTNHTTTAQFDRMSAGGSAIVDFNGTTDYIEIFAHMKIISGNWGWEGGASASWINIIKVTEESY